VLGYPEQALERIHEALTLAREQARPATLANVLFWVAWLHQYRREGPLAQERAEASMTLSTEHGLAARVALGTLMWGWALAVQGHGEEGIAQLRQGMDAFRAAGSVVGRANHLAMLAMLAEAYGNIGQAATRRTPDCVRQRWRSRCTRRHPCLVRALRKAWHANAQLGNCSHAGGALKHVYLER
jgi:hypothetical protein